MTAAIVSGTPLPRPMTLEEYRQALQRLKVCGNIVSVLLLSLVGMGVWALLAPAHQLEFPAIARQCAAGLVLAVIAGGALWTEGRSNLKKPSWKELPCLAIAKLSSRSAAEFVDEVRQQGRPLTSREARLLTTYLSRETTKFSIETLGAP